MSGELVRSLSSAGDLASFEELERVASVMATSRLFKGITSKESAMALMMLCQSEGLHYMQAMRRYHIIEGTPSLRSEVMLADFMARGGTVKWIKRTDEEVTAFFASKGCPDGATITWDNKRIATAGLTGKANHRAYPLAMKQARVISEGVKATDPAVIAGFYAPEEVMDFGHEAPVVPATYPAEPPSPESQERIDAQEKRNAEALATPRKKREKVEPTRNWAAEAAKAEAPKGQTASAEGPAKPAASATASSAAPASAPSTAPSPSGVASPAIEPSSKTASAQDAAESTPEREPGSDDGVIDADYDDVVGAARTVFPDAMEFVDCYKRVAAGSKRFAFRKVDADGNVTYELDGRGPQPKRTLAQNAKMHALFATLEIEKEDKPASALTHGKVVEGVYSLLEKYYGKRSSTLLSVEEAGEVIDGLEKRIERFGTPAQKEQRYRNEGMIKQADGTWRLPQE